MTVRHGCDRLVVLDCSRARHSTEASRYQNRAVRQMQRERLYGVLAEPTADSLRAIALKRGGNATFPNIEAMTPELSFTLCRSCDS